MVFSILCVPNTVAAINRGFKIFAYRSNGISGGSFEQNRGAGAEVIGEDFVLGAVGCRRGWFQPRRFFRF